MTIMEDDKPTTTDVPIAIDKEARTVDIPGIGTVPFDELTKHLPKRVGQMALLTLTALELFDNPKDAMCGFTEMARMLRVIAKITPEQAKADLAAFRAGLSAEVGGLAAKTTADAAPADETLLKTMPRNADGSIKWAA